MELVLNVGKSVGNCVIQFILLKRWRVYPVKIEMQCCILWKKRARKRKNTVKSQSGGDETSQGTSDEASSNASFNKEWNHWVVLHGKEKEGYNLKGMFIIGLVFFLDQGMGRGSQKSVRWVREGVRLVKGVRWWGVVDGGVRMCEMRLLSWNVRGLGGLEKRKEVKDLVREKAPIVLCIQETKMQLIDDFLCTLIWGPLNHDYSYSPSVGASGGLLTVWDTSEVDVWASSRGDHFLLIHGRFIKSNAEFYLFNVYALCDQRAKQTLWTSLSARLHTLGNCNVCLCGDFNYIRSLEERRLVRGTRVVDDCPPFNEFIDDCVLVDLPLGGRKFTWYKGDECSMSRLDRFLLSEEWCLLWPNCIQVAHLKGLSDHCPILLSVDDQN